MLKQVYFLRIIYSFFEKKNKKMHIHPQSLNVRTCQFFNKKLIIYTHYFSLYNTIPNTVPSSLFNIFNP